ncbi:MAG: hypothetical protein MMC33_008880 [Icmadophila ericetorum]|nr:hypothetical protein [Icmadophila ericetorum]
MSASTLSLEHAIPSDIPTLTSIYFSAFHADPLSLTCFPRNNPSIQQWWLENITSAFTSEPTARVIKIVERKQAISSEYSEGIQKKEEIIAFGKWHVLDAATQVGGDDPDSMPTWPAGSPSSLCNNFFGGLASTRQKLMSSRPHYYLELLATLPQHQGRGVASVLIKWGLELADRDGLEAYVEGGPKVKGLYERLGWVERGCVQVDLEGHGGYRESCMVRQGKTTENVDRAP